MTRKKKFIICHSPKTSINHRNSKWLPLEPTLPETNIFAPENGWLEDEISYGIRAVFRGELLVLGIVNTTVDGSEIRPTTCYTRNCVVKHGIFSISTGTGFLPSRVFMFSSWWLNQPI